MCRYLKIAIFLTAFFNLKLQAQERALRKLEIAVSAAINKGYPASVRIWGFDTVRKERTSAQFSGVVATKDGHILTAAHTIEPGKTYKVFFPDGKSCIATALGKIEVKETPGVPDIGLMKIVSIGVWPYAEMGFSSIVKKDATCLSISYPESLDQAAPTVRVGKVITANNRYGFIQSSCKMEPGDSGGPLFDILGRVIALHSAIGIDEDMNFEIPIDLYRKYWKALLLENKYVSLPQAADCAPKDGSGSIVNHIFQKKTPAELPRIKGSTFLITSILDKKSSMVMATLFNTTDASGKKRQVFITKNTCVGENTNIEIGGEKLPLSVLFRDQVTDLVMLAPGKEIVASAGLTIKQKEGFSSPIGKTLFTAREDGSFIQSAMGSKLFDLPKKSSLPYLGTMVVYHSSPVVFSLIKQGSPAEMAGLKMGDELISINGQTIKDTEDFAAAITSYWPGDAIELKWFRDGKTISKVIQLTAPNATITNHPVEKFAGGKSARRDGFKQIYTHDAALTPEMAGSAVFDLKGNFIGINIARYSRASALIMPSSQIQAFINNKLNLKPQLNL
jgi:serine protease Do